LGFAVSNANGILTGNGRKTAQRKENKTGKHVPSCSEYVQAPVPTKLNQSQQRQSLCTENVFIPTQFFTVAASG
jgi:hypothetical protein